MEEKRPTPEEIGYAMQALLDEGYEVSEKGLQNTVREIVSESIRGYMKKNKIQGDEESFKERLRKEPELLRDFVRYMEDRFTPVLDRYIRMRVSGSDEADTIEGKARRREKFKKVFVGMSENPKVREQAEKSERLLKEALGLPDVKQVDFTYIAIILMMIQSVNAIAKYIKANMHAAYGIYLEGLHTYRAYRISKIANDHLKELHEKGIVRTEEQDRLIRAELEKILNGEGKIEEEEIKSKINQILGVKDVKENAKVQQAEEEVQVKEVKVDIGDGRQANFKILTNQQQQKARGPMPPAPHPHLSPFK